MNTMMMSRRTFLTASAATGAACAMGADLTQEVAETVPAAPPARVSYEWWESAYYGYWEIVRGSAFAPCARQYVDDGKGMKRVGSYPWSNVLLGKAFDHPGWIEPAAYLVDPVKYPIVPPVYTLRRSNADLLNIGYSIGGRFFAWMDVYVDPAALAPGAAKMLKDTAGEWAGGRRKPNPSPQIFGIPTPPNEVEFWLSLHTPERTRQFQQHWKENPHDRPYAGPHISLKLSDGLRFFEQEKE